MKKFAMKPESVQAVMKLVAILIMVAGMLLGIAFYEWIRGR